MLSIIASEFDQFSWLSDRWFGFITDNKRDDEVMLVNKKHFEMAVFNALADDIHCADIFLVGANTYDDPNKQLMSWEEFYAEVDAYCGLIKQSSNKTTFIKNLQSEHFEAAKRTDSGFLANEHLSIENGEPVLKKSITKKEDKAVTAFVHEVSMRLPLSNLVDVYMDIEEWLSFSEVFCTDFRSQLH
jgi:hypothetical protein